ncbi:PP2C family protein-serine/threonine phosphatase [bacterium]|nr:PP2C family protein-serine/threonine phosphatase [bacterium]
MIEPKTFYRDFDDLLKKIRLKKTDENFLCSILKEVQKNFGERLHMGSLRLYEDHGDAFVLIRTFDNHNGKPPVESVSLEDEAVQKVLVHGTYIYDEDKVSIDPEISRQRHYAIPAAFVIRSPEKRWIGVFELKSGWVREEVIFSLNAIRTALNYRLHSDAIQTELQQAAQIQKSLLPQRVPEAPGYQIAARSQPTEIVGGDLYDFVQFDDILGVAIGDASGHGLPAALLVRDIVIGMRMGLEKHLKMVHTLQKLNSVIYRSTYSSRFVSLFYGELEEDGHLIYVNAGHPTPLLVRGEKVQSLTATGLILGALPEITLHRAYARIEPGSVLVLFSDGLFERENEKEEIFSLERLKQLVVKHQSKDAQAILDTIFNEIDEFGNRIKWEDDCTMVVIKRLG